MIFETAEDWLDDYYDSLNIGRRPCEPEMRDELILAEQHGLLEFHPEWMPSDIVRKLMGLPEWFGRRDKQTAGQWCGNGSGI